MNCTIWPVRSGGGGEIAADRVREREIGGGPREKERAVMEGLGLTGTDH